MKKSAPGISSMPLKSKSVFSAVIFGLSVIIIMANGCRKDFSSVDKSNTQMEGAKSTAAQQPNIILFIADDFGYELPTFTGGQSYSTPSLDFMAANGMQFSYAFSHPDGYPSRLAMYTGKYNFRNYTYWGVLPAGEKTIGNMLQDAGYATCFSGKWQQDGGDATIHLAGYEKYRVFLPFANDVNQGWRRYKSPLIYENGNFLPDSVVMDKYSEDFYSDYVCDFIDSNKNGTKPFFAIYATVLAGSPFSPTPDDGAAFTAWDYTLDTIREDKSYFPSMVHYEDKMIGKVIQKVRDAGLINNTCFIFCGDNGTSQKIVSQYNGKSFRGGKNRTDRKGIRTPLVVYYPAMVNANQKKGTLIDYTDFMPTLADIAGIPKPTTYGTLDGVSFYDELTGASTSSRAWSFCKWDNSPLDNKIPIRYAFDYNYKLYDSSKNHNFYNLKKDVQEQRPIKDADLTPDEIIEKAYLQNILDSLQ